MCHAQPGDLLSARRGRVSVHNKLMKSNAQEGNKANGETIGALSCPGEHSLFLKISIDDDDAAAAALVLLDALSYIYI